MPKIPCLSNSKNLKLRNKHKKCVCGGHNHSNPKKNKHHHSTKTKLSVRKIRKYYKYNEENFYIKNACIFDIAKRKNI